MYCACPTQPPTPPDTAFHDVNKPACAPRVKTADAAAWLSAGSVGASSPALSGKSLAGPTRLRKTGWGGSKPEEAGPGEAVTRCDRLLAPLCCRHPLDPQARRAYGTKTFVYGEMRFPLQTKFISRQATGFADYPHL